MEQMQTIKKFWNVKTDGKKSNIDLFGYVGGSKEWEDGFNEEDFLKEIRAIPADNELEIAINSFGGSVYTALSIYALLKQHKGAITFRIDGAAMSAATIITSVPGAKVIMPKGSMMMIHKVSSFVLGNVDDFRKAADDMEKLEENILNIYAEKTGKTVEEIKPVVDAETYFTASEAVEFGLADEMDETKTVENRAAGDVVSLNGLEVEAKLFARMPKDFLNSADTQTASAGLSPELKKEEKIMDFETVKAEFPEQMEQVRAEAMNEGVKNERARIQAILALGITGHDEMIADAIQSGKTDGQLAVEVLKAENAKKAAMLANRNADAEDLANIPPAGNEGIEPEPTNRKKSREEQIAEAKAEFEAAKNL